MQRFAQRALEEYFEPNRPREFIIDAATALELGAKAVVARGDVRLVFRPTPPLSTVELTILDPDTSSGTHVATEEARSEALRSIIGRRTISPDEAMKLARGFAPKVLSRTHLEAADRVAKSRNLAVHLGEFHPQLLAELACDFLESSRTMWAVLERWPQELFGDLDPIATERHVTGREKPDVVLEVEIALARRRFTSLGQVGLRRAKATAALGPHRCPACGNAASLSTEPTGTGPAIYRDASDSGPVEVLSCLACEMTVYGSAWIERSMTMATDC